VNVQCLPLSIISYLCVCVCSVWYRVVHNIIIILLGHRSVYRNAAVTTSETSFRGEITRGGKAIVCTITMLLSCSDFCFSDIRDHRRRNVTITNGYYYYYYHFTSYYAQWVRRCVTTSVRCSWNIVDRNIA